MEYIIAPLSWLFGWALEFLQAVLGNYGLAIILLSALVSAILLPLQLWADKLQQKDFNEKDAMRWALDSIKNLSNSQKKFYYTKEIYRRHGYNPIKSMRGLVGLLVQLPFFLAAYFALSSFEGFAGKGFLFIQDLAAPDQLWRGYNILPVIMTLVNLLSAAFYLLPKNNLERSAIVSQLLLPLLFLLLLYQKNAALLLYWTGNNFFSLLKNMIQYRKEYPKIAKQSDSPPHNIIQNIITELVAFFSRDQFFAVCFGLIAYLLLVYFLYHPQEAQRTIHYAPKIAVLLFDIILLFFIYRLRKSLKLNLFLSLPTNQKISLISAVISGIYIGIIHFAKIAKIELTYLTLHSSTIVLLQLAFVLLLLRGFGYTSSKTKIKKPLQLLEVLFLSFLPAIILLNLIHSNLDYFTITNSILFFTISFGLTFVVLLALQKILLRFHLPNYTIIIITTIIANYILTPSLLPYFKLNNNNSLILQIISYLVATSLILFLFQKNKNLLYFSSSGLFVFYLAIYTNDILFRPELFVKVITPKENPSIPSETEYDRKEETFYKGKPPELDPKTQKLAEVMAEDIQKKPNIYFLIYDGYPNQYMMEYYGLDNRNQYKFIKDKGFQMYSNAYTLGNTSITSINQVLEFNDRKYNYSVEKNGLQQGRNIISGSNITNYLLRKTNYTTYHLFFNQYMFQNQIPTVTYIAPKELESSSYMNILYGLLYGQYKFQRHFPIDLAKIKSQVFTEAEQNPRFIYAHTNQPGHHECSIDFKPYLRRANSYMQQDIQNILDTDKDSIIIIAGDHGPYKLKGCESDLKPYPEHQITAQDILDRVGVLLAIKWPADYQAENYKIHTLQDVMPAVFSYMTDTNIANEYNLNMENKSYIGENLIVEDGIIQYGKDKGRPLYYWLKDR